MRLKKEWSRQLPNNGGQIVIAARQSVKILQERDAGMVKIEAPATLHHKQGQDPFTHVAVISRTLLEKEPRCKKEKKSAPKRVPVPEDIHHSAFVRMLDKLEACDEAMAWVREGDKSLSEAYCECRERSWMFWLVGNLLSHKMLEEIGNKCRLDKHMPYEEEEALTYEETITIRNYLLRRELPLKVVVRAAWKKMKELGLR